MIKGINSGRYITVQGGQSSDPYFSPGAAGAGMVRWNPNMNCMEVNDGSMWKQMAASYATIDLTPDVQELIEWARRERDRQLSREQAASNNPALKKAYEAICRAEENFDLLEIISREHNTMEVSSSP